MTTTTRLTIQETLDGATVHRLAEVKGVCLSFFLPDQRPGAPTGNVQTMLRQMVRDVRPSVPAGLLEPMDPLVDDERLTVGGPGWAIFCSAQGVECFRVPGIEKSEYAVAGCFYLTPLLVQALAPREEFILGISRKKMRLWNWKNGVVTEIPWPDRVPVSLDEADGGRMETVGNHATTGTSSSMMSSVQFGSENRPDRERAGHHLTHLYRSVDSGLTPVLGGVPLLLGGVEDDILGYRRAAQYRPVLTQEIAGSMEHMPQSEIAIRARAAAVAEFFAEGAKALAAGRENKALTNPQEILTAAVAGRVHRLVVREGPSVEAVNVAVAASLRMGGEVFVVHPSEMPKEAMVAVLRY